MNPSQPVVAYMYDEDISLHCFGYLNPMRPHRTKLTHNLVEG